MEYKMDTGLVIFDLDGTLLNTIGDLAVACNAVLAMRGLPQHTYDEYCLSLIHISEPTRP